MKRVFYITCRVDYYNRQFVIYAKDEKAAHSLFKRTYPRYTIDTIVEG